MVQNSIKKQDQTKAIEYTSNGETVKLSPGIIRNYLVNGNGAVTDQEIGMFLNLCRFQHLNPFLREAYLIKFGNNPATMVTGKEVFTKRAKRNPSYRGHKAGIITMGIDGDVTEREGTFKRPDDKLAGGWAEVYIDGFDTPLKMTVSMDEYVGRKKDGEINGQWASKPATMIRKVALVQALREAFPEDFSGLYSEEEIATDYPLDEAPVVVTEQTESDPVPQTAPQEYDPLAE